MKDKTFVVFDFETTGKSYITSKIIELGAVRIVDGKIVDTFSTMVNPECRIPAEITRLTGITDDMLVGAPKIEEVLPKFIEFIGSGKLYGFSYITLRKCRTHICLIIWNLILFHQIGFNQLLIHTF